MGLLKEAVSVTQTGSAHPVELCGNVGAPIDAHPDFGLLDFSLPGTGDTAVSAPSRQLAFLVPGCRPGHLLCVYERTAGPERVMRTDEQVALGPVLEVMDGERGDDRVKRPLRQCIVHVTDARGQ